MHSLQKWREKGRKRSYNGCVCLAVKDLVKMAEVCQEQDFWGPAVDLMTAAVNKTSSDQEENYKYLQLDVSPANLRRMLSNVIQLHDKQLVCYWFFCTSSDHFLWMCPRSPTILFKKNITLNWIFGGLPGENPVILKHMIRRIIIRCFAGTHLFFFISISFSYWWLLGAHFKNVNGGNINYKT